MHAQDIVLKPITTVTEWSAVFRSVVFRSSRIWLVATAAAADGSLWPCRDPSPR